MSTDANRLNIERAREALARARSQEVAAAVRSPRPADLSRLQEEEARKASIDGRAASFREEVRERLGLGDYRGPGVPTSSYVSKLMSAPLCDADVCAPIRPSELAQNGPTMAADMPPEGVVNDVTGTISLTEQGDPYTPVSFEAPPLARKRKKFLGIF